MFLVLALLAGVQTASAQSVTITLTQIEGKEDGAPSIDPKLKPLERLFATNPLFRVYKRLRMIGQSRATAQFGSTVSFKVSGGLQCTVKAGPSKRAGFVHIDCDVFTKDNPPKLVAHLAADLKSGGTTFLKPGRPADLILAVSVRKN